MLRFDLKATLDHFVKTMDRVLVHVFVRVSSLYRTQFETLLFSQSRKIEQSLAGDYGLWDG